MEPEQEHLFFHALMESIPDRIYFKDRESRYLRVNREIARLFDIENPDDLVGKCDHDFFPEADAERMVKNERDIILSGKPILGKVGSQTLPNGGTAWTLTSKLPLRNAAGDIVGTFGISKDITKIREMEEALEAERNRLREKNEELRAAQAQIVEAEKAASVARLAFGVAHEIRNPLAILSMGLDCLPTERDGTPDPVAVQMREAVRRANAIIDELMQLSTSGETNLVPTKLATVLDRAIGNLADEADGVQVVREYESGLESVALDPTKIERALFCLMQNSVQAMETGGTLTARTYSTTLESDDVKFDPGFRSSMRLHPGEKVAVVEIDDTGSGIAAEDQAKLFDPFFTTKPTGLGTGLGLTVARKLLEANNALLSIANRPDGGVRATVIFKL